ncbi:AraC family transcriptional regulator [Halomonas sp. BM-2019]|uniref:AraC family transcriptional regulator n=1 Tax=Halomonas sp. BM-2019 TaxID=2811227 RepID=UPI001B3C29F8|nr:MAG: helix-turn-helix domain-containing protein [Halomonas sp. BM-2019]
MTRPIIETRAYSDRVLTDRHAFHQLLLGLEGCVELEVGGRGVRVERGVLAPVGAGDEHHYLAPRDNATLVLDLPVAWCEALQLEALFEGRPRRLPATLAARGRHLGATGAPALAGWLSEVLAEAAPFMHEPRLRLLRLLPEIEADLARPWRVRDWAARCHLAEAAFARQFRALTGQSPHAWLVARRLARARTLMGASLASLTEIALACGFGDAAHFSRVFRSRHGCSPRQWRDRHCRPVSRTNPAR